LDPNQPQGDAVPKTLLLSAALLLGGCVAAQPAATHAPTAPLVVTDMGGDRHDLDAALAAGERVVLVFWQTWCGPCRAEAPEVAAAAQADRDGLRFYGVVPGRDDTVDDDEVRRVAKAWGYAFPQVRDRDLALSRRFGVTGTPTVLVLGPGAGLLHTGRAPPDDWSALARAEGPGEPAVPGAK
jgi:thiol-disulfide isomerase/thioredoxin